MGTRGAVGVRFEDKIYATYNHFDSYPDGLGADMVAFCQKLSKEQLEVLKERFKHVVLVDEQTDKPTPEDQKKYVEAGFYDDRVGHQTPADWYGLLRNIQGMEYLDAVLDGRCQHWIDSKDFLKDSLFCEYAYLINLDDNSLEFYEGFNKKPDKHSPLPFPQEPGREDRDYYPVRFKGKAAINAIPDDWIEKFYPSEDA